MDIEYIQLDQVIFSEPVNADILEELLELGIVAYKRQETGMILIARPHCEDFRAMLRLATELEINPAGVATIMHMRKKMERMSSELRRLQRIEKAYQNLRPSSKC